MLIYPNPESALNEEAGKLLLEHYAEYSKQAKMITEIYAKPIKESKENDSSKTIDSTNKKRVAEKIDKKKLEKKRALKRL